MRFGRFSAFVESNSVKTAKSFSLEIATTLIFLILLFQPAGAAELSKEMSCLTGKNISKSDTKSHVQIGRRSAGLDKDGWLVVTTQEIYSCPANKLKNNRAFLKSKISGRPDVNYIYVDNRNFLNKLGIRGRYTPPPDSATEYFAIESGEVPTNLQEKDFEAVSCVVSHTGDEKKILEGMLEEAVLEPVRLLNILKSSAGDGFDSARFSKEAIHRLEFCHLSQQLGKLVESQKSILQRELPATGDYGRALNSKAAQ